MHKSKIFYKSIYYVVTLCKRKQSRFLTIYLIALLKLNANYVTTLATKTKLIKTVVIQSNNSIRSRISSFLTYITKRKR